MFKKHTLEIIRGVTAFLSLFLGVISMSGSGSIWLGIAFCGAICAVCSCSASEALGDARIVSWAFLMIGIIAFTSVYIKL